MPKKLAVFCDGTWNDLRSGHLTNVARLAKCVAPRNRQTGATQIVFYDEGVGVSSGITWLADKIVKYFGGGFGRGLDFKVEAAYRFLVLNYDPDDEIFIFGFSRGAYTARSLCGLIRKCGIIRRDCFDQIPEAIKRYRNELHPRDPTMIEFRQTYSHPRSAGPEDHDWVGLQAARSPAAPLSEENQRAHSFQHRRNYAYRLMYLGVWDTVGSLGIPDRYRWLLWLNRKYKFHDPKVSSLIASIRHAVALEEDRRVFNVSAMKNLDDLNAEWSKQGEEVAQKWDVVNRDAPNYVPYNHQPYQEVWFPGGHGAVGGGNAEEGLSSATLLWVAEGAVAAGLSFRRDPQSELYQAVNKVDPLANWRIDKKGEPLKGGEKDLLGEAGGYRPRKGPVRDEQVGMTSRMRWKGSKWRPDTLRVLGMGDGEPHPAPRPPPGFPEMPDDIPPLPGCYPRAEVLTPDIVVVGEAPEAAGPADP